MLQINGPKTDDIDIYLDRKASARSLAEFTKRAWHIVEPATPLKWGWAMDAMCDHLEAITWEEIVRLLMNVPPGMMKSKLCGVFWPAWEWGPAKMPHLRFMGTSHNAELAMRDNNLCRRLIQSSWYQARWPIKINQDQNAKTKFENDKTGFRESMAFTRLTGSRGDRVLLDDPHSVDQAESEAELINVRRNFKEALPSRVNNEKSAIVVIMQRLSGNDVSSIILEEPGFEEYVHLMLPMFYEAERKCKTILGFKDPRTVDGQLLFPERFSLREVEKLEEQLGPYASAGQLQQRPTSREGGMFKLEYFKDKYINEADIPPGTIWVRHWDLAASTSIQAARTAGVLLGKTPDGRYIVGDCKAERIEGFPVRKLILKTSLEDPPGTLISLPQDPGQAGKVQKADFAVLLAGKKFRIKLESGDKKTRAEPFASQCEAGNVYILRGKWNKPYISELCEFPGGKFVDRVDASSGAFGNLVSGTGTKARTKTVPVG